MAIARTLASAGWRRANHRWLATIQLGLWLLLASAALTLILTAWSYMPSFRAVYYYSYLNEIRVWWDWLIRFLQAWIASLQIVAVWILTTREPGLRRDDSPRRLAACARWLRVVGQLTPMVCACVPALILTWNRPEGYILRDAAHSCVSVSVVCLLLMLRQYALRNDLGKIAARLQCCAIVGAGLALTVFAANMYFLHAWLASQREAWWGTLTVAILATTVCYTCLWLWAGLTFALRLRQSARRQRPRIRLGRMVIRLLASAVIGGVLAAVASEVLSIQVSRLSASESELRSATVAIGRYLPEIVVVLAALILPPHLTIFYRKWNRSRRGRR